MTWKRIMLLSAVVVMIGSSAVACVAPAPPLPNPVIECDSLVVSSLYSPPAINGADDVMGTLGSPTELVGCTDNTGRGVSSASLTGTFDVQGACSYHPPGEEWAWGTGEFQWSDGSVSGFSGTLVAGSPLVVEIELTSGLWAGSTASLEMNVDNATGRCYETGIAEVVISGGPFLLRPPGWTPPPPPPPVLPLAVDQENLGTQFSFVSRNENHVCDGTPTVLEVAQTFTAGQTGNLERVSLVAQPYPSALALEVGVHPVLADGTPSETQIGSGSYSGLGSPSYTSLVDLTLDVPAPVVSGQQYGIVLTTPQSDYCGPTDDGWSMFGASDTYEGGLAYQRGTLGGYANWTPSFEGSPDLFFRTWVRPLASE